MLNGLPVKVETLQSGYGLIASNINFKNDDLEMASMIRNGTSQQFAEQTAATEALRGRLGDMIFRVPALLSSIGLPVAITQSVQNVIVGQHSRGTVPEFPPLFPARKGRRPGTVTTSPRPFLFKHLITRTF